MNAYRKQLCNNIVNLNPFFKGKLFLVKCPFKAKTNLPEPGGFFFQPCVFFLPVKSSLVQDQQSMKIVINHQTPEIKTAWQAANHSQIFFPPGPRCSLCLLRRPICCFPIQSPFYMSRHRDAGRTPSDASRCGACSPHSRHVRRLWSF